MKSALLNWVTTYPRDPGYRDGSFANTPVGKTVRTVLPTILQQLIHQRGRYALKGSIGQSDWADVPWVAVMDQSVTTSIQEGYYLVYLLSRGCDRLYLVLGQGCTRLYNESGKKTAEAELKRRGAAMRARAEPSAVRLQPVTMDLNAPQSNWRASLYEASAILGKEYDTQALPSQEALEADFREALELYRLIAREGGWESDDAIAQDAEQDGIQGTLKHLKTYRNHRRVERSAKHAREVKKKHKPECAGCGFETKTAYRIAESSDIDILEAHHLIPLHTLADGETASFDIMKDFALLCPNCHRLIHKLGAEDLEGLKAIVQINWDH